MTSFEKTFDCVAFQRLRREQLARATQHLSNREFHAWVSGLAARSQELWDMVKQLDPDHATGTGSSTNEERREDGGSHATP